MKTITNKQNLIKNSERGFTLLEALVALAILMTAFTAPLAIAARGIVSTAYAKNQITAIYLAQEGIELARGLRDGLAINGNFNWDEGLEDCLDQGCMIDPLNLTVIKCDTVNGCPKIKKDPTSGVYGYVETWIETAFKRAIRYQQIDTEEILITSEVTWNQIVDQKVSVKETLFKWQQ